MVMGVQVRPLPIPYLTASLDTPLASKATRPGFTLPSPPPPSQQPTNQQTFSTFCKCPTTGDTCSPPPPHPTPPHTQELASQEYTTKPWDLRRSKELGRMEE